MTDEKIIKFLRIYALKYIYTVLNAPPVTHEKNYECSEITVSKKKPESEDN